MNEQIIFIGFVTVVIAPIMLVGLAILKSYLNAAATCRAVSFPSFEAIQQSAEMAFLSGKTIDDCPPEMALYHTEWAEAFRLAQFEQTCEDAPC